MDIDELRKIISTREFEGLIDKFELSFLECKREPYRLDNDHGKSELAKDISSFANAEGGFILIGIETEKDPVRNVDKISKLNPMPENVIDATQYRNVSKGWLYPTPDVRVEWHAINEDSSKGIWVIEIPKQDQSRKPFLITKFVIEGRQRNIMFGMCTRDQENCQPLDHKEIHEIFNKGLLFKDSLETRLKAIEMSIKSLLETSPAMNIEDWKTDIQPRVENAIAEAGFDRSLILYAYVNGPSVLRTFASSEVGNIRSILENPPKIRDLGFGLRTLDTAKILKGEYCRVKARNLKVIDLYRDGMLICVLNGDEDFLSWASPKTPLELRINPVVILETFYGFAALYEKVLGDLKDAPDNITVTIEFRGLMKDEKISYLTSLELNQGMTGPDVTKNHAGENKWSKELPFPSTPFDKDRIAFDIAKEVFLFFGILEEDIPYTKVVEGKRILDLDKIKGL